MASQPTGSLNSGLILSCSTLTFSRLSLGEALSEVKKIGFRYVDLGMVEGWAHVSPSRVLGDTDSVVREVEGELERAGLSPVTANVGFGRCTQEERAERFAAVCEFAARVGVPLLTLAPTGGTAEEQAKELRVRLPVAARYGIALTVETHRKSVTETPEQAMEVCRLAPGAGLTWDPTHFLIATGTWRPPAELLRFVKHVHIRDSGRSDAEIQVGVGRGAIPHHDVIALLLGAGYVGAISTEVIDSIGDLDSAAETSALVRVMRDEGVSQ
ncbi:MAG: sugar phosphate isomerase/epimerase [Nitrososphaerota archaeon]|jgi:sugar phosphate isomerase/epimerase|nr:sugar phosphate isomerase/epimerase [Nitrososphaerota archaeon]MDG6955286.1 sugar phosphate isomerase/epimerase [Nitrososphaerota archaeon]